MPGAGIEPAQPYGYEILSLACLPLPPPRRYTANIAVRPRGESVTSRPSVARDPASTVSLRSTCLRLSIPHASKTNYLLQNLEAQRGIEPLHGGFANRSVTTSPLGHSLNYKSSSIRCLFFSPSSIANSKNGSLRRFVFDDT